MISLIFSTLLFASPYCSNPNEGINPKYEALQNSIDQKIAQSANLVTVAKEADAVLSKLLSSKSPIIMNWFEKRNLLNEPEEKIAKEWRKYYLENFILTKYPTPHADLNSSVESLFNDINELSFNAEDKKKTTKLFQEAQNKSIEVVKTWKIDEETKKEIISKISTIKLYWFEKLKGSKYQNIPLEFIKWGVAYDPVTNEINLGVQAKRYGSDATLFSVLVHEIGHSFDPCRWSAFFKQKNPFDKLYSCLRDEKSAGAKPRDDSRMQEMLDKKFLNQAMVDSLKSNPTCNRTIYPPTGTQKDQLLEVFADWFAAEVVAESTYLTSDLRKDLCNDQDLSEGSSYLSHKDRLEKIYFAHPKVQKALKQKPSAKYCNI